MYHANHGRPFQGLEIVMESITYGFLLNPPGHQKNPPIQPGIRLNENFGKKEKAWNRLPIVIGMAEAEPIGIDGTGQAELRLVRA
jgi:hypothetical protein